MPLDRNKYLDLAEIRTLTSAALGWATDDLAKGKRQGVVAWMLADLLLQSGMRIGEAAACNCGDVVYSRDVLIVHSLKLRKPVDDEIPCTPDLARHFRDYIEWKRTIGEPTDDRSPLLLSKRDVRFTTRGLEYLWATIMTRAGLPASVTPHAARHSVGVHLFDKTNDLRKVQVMLRHRDINTTTIYAEPLPHRMARAVKNMYDGRGPEGDAEAA